MRRRWIGLSEAAITARINRERLLRLVQSGQVQGRRNVTGRWEVNRGSLDTYLSSRTSGARTVGPIRHE